MISFFSLYEIFPHFIFVNHIESPVDSLLGVKIFVHFPSFTSSSSPSSDGMGGTASISSLLPSSSKANNFLMFYQLNIHTNHHNYNHHEKKYLG